eukprot:1504193-Rhodomonas_salina.2
MPIGTNLVYHATRPVGITCLAMTTSATTNKGSGPCMCYSMCYAIISTNKSPSHFVDSSVALAFVPAYARAMQCPVLSWVWCYQRARREYRRRSTRSRAHCWYALRLLYAYDLRLGWLGPTSCVAPYPLKRSAILCHTRVRVPPYATWYKRLRVAHSLRGTDGEIPVYQIGKKTGWVRTRWTRYNKCARLVWGTKT